jgi:hypothetical protein
MKPSPSAVEHWPPIGTGIWMRWWGYLVRWLVFGVIVHVFTVAENTLNTPRVNWKSWLIVLASWLAVKVTFVSVVAALD